MEEEEEEEEVKKKKKLADTEWRNGTALWGSGRRLERCLCEGIKKYQNVLIYDGRWHGRDSNRKFQNKVIIDIA